MQRTITLDTQTDGHLLTIPNDQVACMTDHDDVDAFITNNKCTRPRDPPPKRVEPGRARDHLLDAELSLPLAQSSAQVPLLNSQFEPALWTYKPKPKPNNAARIQAALESIHAQTLLRKRAGLDTHNLYYMTYIPKYTSPRKKRCRKKSSSDRASNSMQMSESALWSPSTQLNEMNANGVRDADFLDEVEQLMSSSDKSISTDTEPCGGAQDQPFHFTDGRNESEFDQLEFLLNSIN